MFKDNPGNPHPVAFFATETIDNSCEPEQVLPSQWKAFLTSKDRSPEWNLLFKVMVQAFRDYCLLPHNSSHSKEEWEAAAPKKVKEMRENVRWWIEDPDERSPNSAFSFAYCVEIVLGVDVGQARKQAIAFLDHQDKTNENLFGETGQQLKNRIKLPRQSAVIKTGPLSGDAAIMHTGTSVGLEIRKTKRHIQDANRRRKHHKAW